MWFILGNLTDTATQALCIKAALSIIKGACRKISRNCKTPNWKERNMLRSPTNRVCCVTILTYVLSGFLVQSVEKRAKVSVLISTLLCTQRAGIVTKSYPVSLWWMPSRLTLRWGVSLQALFQLFKWFTKSACNT